MKIALCFIINYEHILNKEHIWRKWIEANEDIINVYFFYETKEKIKSEWILKHTISAAFIYNTSYFNVVPAYMSLMRYAYVKDNTNQWFCFLTDSCCPIISPKKFRYLFFNYYNKSIFSWKYAWWNVVVHTRANLRLLPDKLKLANDPYFILKREDVCKCLQFLKYNVQLSNTIIQGGLANESFFAIALKYYNVLDQSICKPSHMVDWSRMTSSTSPFTFYEDTTENRLFIESNKTNKFNMFIRKIAPDFPDNVLNDYIYKYSKNDDDKLIICYPIIHIYQKYKYLLWVILFFVCFIYPVNNFYYNVIYNICVFLKMVH